MIKRWVSILAVLTFGLLIQLACIGSRAKVILDETQCWNEPGMIWLCDDEECNTGHCEPLRSAQGGTGNATEEPAEEGVGQALVTPTLDEMDSTHLSSEDLTMVATSQAGEPIDECDARDQITPVIVLKFDEIQPDGTRWCESLADFGNYTNQEYLLAIHTFRHDDRYPEDGPFWEIRWFSPGEFIEQQRGFHGFLDGGYNCWYNDRIAVIYKDCVLEWGFTEYDVYDMPESYIEPYAFAVPYYCTP